MFDTKGLIFSKVNCKTKSLTFNFEYVIIVIAVVLLIIKERRVNLNKEKSNYHFINIPRNFFQVNENYNSTTIFSECHGIKNKFRYKGVTEENLISIYVILAMMRNNYDKANLSIRYILELLGLELQTNNYKNVRSCLKILKEVQSVNLIDFSFDIDEVKNTDTIRFHVNNIDNFFMTIDENEMEMLSKIGHRLFATYLVIKNFYLRDERYSSIGIDRLAGIMGSSTRTVTNNIRELYALDIINIEGGIYQWNEWVGKSTRTPHKYYFKPKRVKEIAEMSKEEIQAILSSVDGKEKKELKMMTRWLLQGNREVSDEQVKLVQQEYERLPDEDKLEIQEVLNNQIQYGSSDEYMKIAYLYSYYKVKVKELGKNKLQNIIIKGEKVS